MCLADDASPASSGAGGGILATKAEEGPPLRAAGVGMEATTGFEPVIGVLQTLALPLGYVAQRETHVREDGAEDGI